MVEFDDNELVRQYVCSGSEQAFTTLVMRHLNLVYSVALRQVGNAHHAEEICQAVFLILARKASNLQPDTVIPGWLYQTARLTAANHRRTEYRRARREQEAQMDSSHDEPGPEAWAQVAPLLEDAMAQLNQRDRDAIVLRFFEGKAFHAVAAALGATEDAAKMRVGRAVEKLRKYFTKRGVSLSAAALCAVVSANSIQAAPAGLGTCIAASVLSGSICATSTLTLIKTTLKIMAWTKTKTAMVVGVGLLFTTGTSIVTVHAIRAHQDSAWQVENLDTGILNQVPPQVRIVPTRFPQSSGWGSSNDKVLGIGQTPEFILLVAYRGVSRSRLVLPPNLPQAKYDFIANLPQRSLEALQEEAKKQFGLQARHEPRAMDVLRLTVKKAGADGLRQSKSAGGSARSSAGHFSCVNQPLSSLVSTLENQLKVPVLDYTELKGRFDIDLDWDQPDAQHLDPDDLKKALLEELGLELVPDKESVDVLVVERVK